MKRTGGKLAASVVIGTVMGFWLALADGARVLFSSLDLFENPGDVSLVLIYGFISTVLLTVVISTILSLLISIKITTDVPQHAGATASGFVLLLLLIGGLQVLLSPGLNYDPGSHAWPLYIGGILIIFASLGFLIKLVTARIYKHERWPYIIGSHFALTSGIGEFIIALALIRYLEFNRGFSDSRFISLSMENILYILVAVVSGFVTWFILRLLFNAAVKCNRLIVPAMIILIVMFPMMLFGGSSESDKKVESYIHPRMKGRNVVLISIDTLRYDALGCNDNDYIKTPNIDALAREGILFENCLVPVPLTIPSHTSMLTGQIPRNHGVRTQQAKLDESVLTLQELLSDKGFHCCGFISMAMLRGDSCGLDRGFDYYGDSWTYETKGRIFPPEVKYLWAGIIIKRIFNCAPPTANRVERNAKEVVDDATEWIHGIKGPDFFCFLHLFDPHWEYKAPEPYRAMYAEGYSGIVKSDADIAVDPWNNIDLLGEYDIDYFRSLYDGEVSYVDAELGRLFRNLKGSGRWDDTMIILTADHGESFGHDYLFDHRYRLYQSCIHVPLIIKPFNGAEGERVDTICSITDILPTICDAFDIDSPNGIDGRSLNSLIEHPKLSGITIYPHMFCESDGVRSGSIEAYSKTYSVTKDGFKLIYSPWTVAPEPVYRMYNLALDENELVDIYDPSSAVANELTALVQTWFDSDEDPPQNITGAIDRENLRSLQYLR